MESEGLGPVQESGPRGGAALAAAPASGKGWVHDEPVGSACHVTRSHRQSGLSG